MMKKLIFDLIFHIVRKIAADKGSGLSASTDDEERRNSMKIFYH